MTKIITREVTQSRKQKKKAMLNSITTLNVNTIRTELISNTCCFSKKIARYNLKIIDVNELSVLALVKVH